MNRDYTVTTDMVARTGVAGMIGGVVWAVIPGIVQSVTHRGANLLFILPIAFIIVAMLGLQLSSHLGLLGNFGYYITLAAFGLLTAGALLEVVFNPVTLSQLDLGGGRIFFIGFYLIVVGAPILGVGLWTSSDPFRLGAVLLLAAVPIAVFGPPVLNQLGYGRFNWTPFTVPIGCAWIAIGYSIRTNMRQFRGDDDAANHEAA